LGEQAKGKKEGEEESDFSLHGQGINHKESNF
jgi:hypothetical protein